jgi:type IV secretion system protein VirB8
MKADAQALKGYFAEAASWDADKRSQGQRVVRLALWVAGAGWAAVLALSLGVMLLLPLKTVEPFVIRVDNATGIVDVVPEYHGGAPANEIVTRYLLTHYVGVCERFGFFTAESDYEECGAFNTAQRNQAWYARWNPSNPSSPLNLYKDGTSVRSEVSAVSFFKRQNGLNDLAQVRYIKAKRAAGSTAEDISHWIATVQYAYADAPTDPKVRRWNPLGFRIVDFRSEPEIVTEAPTAAAEPKTAAATTDTRSSP